MEVHGQFQVLATIPVRKKFWHPMNRKLYAPQSPPGQFGGGGGGEEGEEEQQRIRTLGNIKNMRQCKIQVTGMEMCCVWATVGFL